MLTVRIDGYSGKISALISGEITSTGVVIQLHGALGEAVNAILAHEREACAKIADQYPDRIAAAVAEAIRERGSK